MQSALFLRKDNRIETVITFESNKDVGQKGCICVPKTKVQKKNIVSKTGETSKYGGHRCKLQAYQRNAETAICSFTSQ